MLCARCAGRRVVNGAGRYHIDCAVNFRPRAEPGETSERPRHHPSRKILLLRPERLLVLDRLVRNELTLQRLLAAGRRAASSRMSAIRRTGASPVSAKAATVTLPFCEAI